MQEALAKRDVVNFYDLKIWPTTDPNVVFAEFKQDSPIADSDRHYTQIYVHKFVFRDGRVVRWDEYFDPMRILDAFGGLEKAIEFMAAR